MPKIHEKYIGRRDGELCSPVIMVGDANPLNRKLLRDILTTKGYQVLEMTNGKHVVDSLIHRKPDLAMLNVNILGLSGPEVMARIRKEKILENVPVIIVGHWPKEATPIEGDAYFKHPISATQLCSTIDTLLAQYRKYAVS